MLFSALWLSYLGVIGLCLGSFAGATVWRLRFKQLQADKLAGEGYDKMEFQKLSRLHKKSWREDYSRCLTCGQRLAWFDLVPLFSWLFLRGRCRYCKAKIGWLEPIVELALAVFFIASWLVFKDSLGGVWSILAFILWLVVGVLLAILFIYDYYWQLLPDIINYLLIGVAVTLFLVKLALVGWSLESVLSALGGVAILAGLYLVLYFISGGRWVGFGDIKLNLGLALALADWKLALLNLFLANLAGSLIVLPMLLTKKLQRQSHIPFGPLLIIGFLLTSFLGQGIINWYLGLIP